MGFCIGIILLFVWLVIRAGDKAVDRTHDMERQRLENADRTFKATYTDSELDTKIREYVRDPMNKDKAWKEFSETLSDNKNWEKYSKRDAGLENRIRTTLLANRGKLYDGDSTFGAGAAYRYEFDYVKKLEAFEWVETIRDILNDRGVNVELMYDIEKDRYVWKNSYAYVTADPQKLLPFDRSLLDWHPEDIPPPLKEIQ